MMKKHFYFALKMVLVFFLISCKKEEIYSDIQQMTTKKFVQSTNNIRFDFNAKSSQTDSEYVEVKAELTNLRKDTVYFLTTSCEGEKYSLVYDTIKLKLEPQELCNLTVLKIVKLAPLATHSFKANFKTEKEVKNLDLAFDFYEVAKNFDLTGNNISTLKIFNRKKEDKNLIIAPTELIK